MQSLTPNISSHVSCCWQWPDFKNELTVSARHPERLSPFSLRLSQSNATIMAYIATVFQVELAQWRSVRKASWVTGASLRSLYGYCLQKRPLNKRQRVQLIWSLVPRVYHTSDWVTVSVSRLDWRHTATDCSILRPLCGTLLRPPYISTQCFVSLVLLPMASQNLRILLTVLCKCARSNKQRPFSDTM